MARASKTGLLAAALLLTACAQGPGGHSVQGVWASDRSKDCKDWTVTISATTLSMRLVGTPLDQDIDLREDSRGADADVYLVGRDLSRKVGMTFPMRLTVQDGKLTFSSDSKNDLGTAWLHLIQLMQPLHRCNNS